MALTRVQGAPKSSTGVITFVSPPSVGNGVIVAVVAWGATAINPTGVVDNRGNTYSLAVTANNSNARVAIYYCAKIVTTGTPFTVTFTGAGSYSTAIEVGGLGAASLAIDQTASQTTGVNTATPLTGTTAALTGSDDFAVIAHSNNTSLSSLTVESVSPAWTQEFEDLSWSNATGEVDSRPLTGYAGTTQNGSWTANAASTWAGVIAVFSIPSAAPEGSEVETTTRTDRAVFWDRAAIGTLVLPVDSVLSLGTLPARVAGELVLSVDGAGELTAGALASADLPAGAVAAHKTTHQDGGTDELALDGSQITTGTVVDARLSSNVALENVTNRFTEKQEIQTGSADVASRLTFIDQTMAVDLRRWQIQNYSQAFRVAALNDAETTLTGLISLDRAGTLSLTGDLLEKGRPVAMGHWQTVDLSTLSVTAGCTGSVLWTLIGKTMCLSAIMTVTLAAPVAYVRFTLPGGHTSAGQSGAVYPLQYYIGAGAGGLNRWSSEGVTLLTGTVADFYTLGLANWPAGAGGPSYISINLTFPIA